MSKTMLQIICVMLFMCLVLVGCQKPGSTTGDTTADSRTEGTTGPQIKPVDYNEHVFHVLEVGRIDSLNNFAGYQTGDVLSAAIYRRNAEVEQLFNIKITYEQYATGVTSMSPDGYGRLEKASLSGTTDYDIAVVPGYDVGMLACNGFLYDFYSIPGIDLKNEYWDQQTIDACSIKKMLFFVTGDLVLDAFDSTMCIAFNKKLVVDHGIDENFYALVEKGEWTIDKFIAISQLVNEDLNGDGVYNDKDLYGTLVWNDSIYGVVSAAGQRVVTLDADDNMELTLGTETTFSVFTKYVEFVKSNAALRFQQNFLANGSTTQNPASTLHVTMFQNDQALFLTATIKMLAKFREMDANYGILPYFKYDTSQNAYHSPLSGYDIRYLCVPVIQENVERTGTILEGLGFYSQKYLLEAYYDKTLTGRTVRDEESLPMLEIMRKTRFYDLGYIYQPANINKQLNAKLQVYATEFIPTYESLKNAATTALDNINKLYSDLVDEWK